MMFWIILFWLAWIFSKEEHRELKGSRSSGGSRTTRTTTKTTKKTTASRSTYTSSYNGRYTGNSGVYRYSSYANPYVYTNSYWNPALGRTSQPFYVYYLPPNYYTPIGYYSYLYGLVYYNGYGYNFYYATYGYYQYSVNEVPPVAVTVQAR